MNINGHPRTFEELNSPASLAEVVEHMKLKADRVAVVPSTGFPERRSGSKATQS